MLSAMNRVSLQPESDADDESWVVVSDDPQLCELGGPESSSPSTTSSGRFKKGLASRFEGEERYSMDDCLRVLESEPFVKTKKQRSTAWKENTPPPVHRINGALLWV